MCKTCNVYDQHGTVYKYNLIGFEIAIVGDPDCAEYMLKTNFNNYIKGPILHDLLRDLLGNGIFVADGELWVAHRKIAGRLFGTKTLKTLMLDTFVHHAKSVVQILDDKKNQSVEIQDLFYRFTFDSIGTKFRIIQILIISCNCLWS